jgi:beta-glucosidase-like glycosyl hydrolase
MFRLSLLFLAGLCFATSIEYLDPKYIEVAKKEVDRLTTRQKIARLFFAPCFSVNNELYLSDLKALVKKHQIGGILFSTGTLNAQKTLQEELSALCDYPLLFAIDGEWGAAMRLKDMVAFPYQMTLGAIQDETLLYEVGKAIGNQCLKANIHFNFAPVLDVNNNPKNPVIKTRSFGDDAQSVARKGQWLFQGMQSMHVVAFGKHFCGHGDTQIDSHLSLPVLNFEQKRLETIELIPFKQAIQAGIGGIMMGHLLVPCIDPIKPISLSEQAIKGLLTKECGFNGLVVCDAFDMNAVKESYGMVLSTLMAYTAGADFFIYLKQDPVAIKETITEVIPAAIEKIDKKIKEGLFSKEELDEKVIKLIAAQKWTEERQKTPLAIDDEQFTQLLFDKAITYLGKAQNLMLEKKPIQLVQFGNASSDYLHRYLEKDFDVQEKELEQLDPSLKTVCILYNNIKDSQELKKLPKNTLFVLLSHPYHIQFLDIDSDILVCYEDTLYAQISAYKALTGIFFPQGKLPVHIQRQ